MKILIDIGHPAHLHYFRNFAMNLLDKGNQVVFVTRDKDVTLKLFEKYEFIYFCSGKNRSGLLGKIIGYYKTCIYINQIARKFKPDIFLSFYSPYAALIGFLHRKPVIGFADTENASFNIKLTRPFTSDSVIPSCFIGHLSKNEIRFNGYMELCYLHPNRFKPDRSILKELGVKENEKYVIMRFVSWKASHDIGHSGLTLEMKHKAVKEFSKYAKVFISSEAELPEELKQYQIKITPEKMHDVLAFATLYIGEGATMASECAVLGTPAIYVNSLTAGTLEEQEKYGLISGYRNSDGVLQKAKEFLQIPNLKEEYQSRRMKMLEDKIDVTAFMVWFIENYPESVKIMKENSEYQMRFK